MAHHSHFHCVQVEGSTDVPTLTLADFSNGGYEFNQGHVVCPGGNCVDSTEEPPADPIFGLLNPSFAILACQVPVQVSSGMVGFANVKYSGTVDPDQHFPEYQRGCINEWAPSEVLSGNTGGSDDNIWPWRNLCPGWSENPYGTTGIGDVNDYGRIRCGCNFNYGGLDCEIGCPDDQHFLSDQYQIGPREGYWLCSDFSVTGYESLDPYFGPALVGTETGAICPAGTECPADYVCNPETAICERQYVLRGEIPKAPTDGQPLCEDPSNDCASGYSIR
jgi:hypothetical protein